MMRIVEFPSQTVVKALLTGGHTNRGCLRTEQARCLLPFGLSPNHERVARCHHLVPRPPGPIELAHVGKAVVSQCGGVPTVSQAVAHELKEPRTPTHVDEETGGGIALAVEAH